MPAEPIPDEHHVARHCQPTSIREDGTPGPGAFICDDADGISCNWLEYFSSERAQQVSEVRAALAAQRKIRRSHKLAILNVGVARRGAFERLGQQIAIVKDPRIAEDGKQADPSHALVEQVAEAVRVALGEALAACVQEVGPATE